MKVFLKLLSYIYSGLNSFNKKLYLSGFFKTHKVSAPVLSVGNLSVGGTGKTPVMIYLIQLFQSQRHKIGVVSKNYKCKAKGIVKIHQQDQGANYFGDEPYLINQKTNAIGYVGPKKFQVAKEIVRNEKVDYIFIDDGFQHLALYKNCNILLIDVTQWEEPLRLLPWGRYRDNLAEINKAHILFWTKVNLISQEKFAQIKNQVAFTGRQFEFQFLTENFLLPSSEQIKSLQVLPKRVVLFCGLANPQPLIDVLKSVKTDIEIIVKLFPDHHQYSERDLKKILDKPLNYKFFLTTEKDWVKMKALWPAQEEIGVVLLDLKLNRDNNELYEVISGFLD